MSDYAVLGDLLVIYAVSTAVVFVFHQFRLPSIAGFLVAGALIGPHGLHLIPDVSQVQVLAEIGIVLLLFTIGMEFSSAHFAAARRILMVAAPVQTGASWSWPCSERWRWDCHINRESFGVFSSH